jgi:hypothetical protein
MKQITSQQSHETLFILSAFWYHHLWSFFFFFLTGDQNSWRLIPHFSWLSSSRITQKWVKNHRCAALDDSFDFLLYIIIVSSKIVLCYSCNTTVENVIKASNSKTDMIMFSSHFLHIYDIVSILERWKVKAGYLQFPWHATIHLWVLFLRISDWQFFIEFLTFLHIPIWVNRTVIRIFVAIWFIFQPVFHQRNFFLFLFYYRGL